MEEVLQYLEMKNHYYEKFYTVTQRFLDHVARNDWKDLDFFVDSRERILNIIRSFDVKISKAMEEGQREPQATDVDKVLMNQMMEHRRKLADKILDLDLQLIAAIDDYKNETIRELKKTVDTQKSLELFERNSAPSPRVTKIAKA